MTRRAREGEPIGQIESRLDFIQRLTDIGQDIVDMLKSDRQPHLARRHARGGLVFNRQLRMRCRCRVDRQGPRIADVCDMV